MFDDKKENRGGAREGAGRPKKERSFSDAFKRQLEKALKTYKHKTGKNYGEMLVGMFYDETVMDTARLGAAKIIADVLAVKESKRIIESLTAPTIGLPPIMQKPLQVEAEAEHERVH